MSVKRQATTELNHDNWDQEDPADHEEVGTFKIASKDILEKRVIRTAKRRTQVTSEEPKKSVFSGFGGFNKQQPSSFDFLSKLTNGSNENNTSTKADSSAPSTLFTSKPLPTSPSAGLFSPQSTSGSTITTGSSLFGGSLTNKSSPVNIFTSQIKTPADSPFKIQTETNSTDNKIESTKSTVSNTFDSSKLDASATNSNTKSLFSSTSSPFQMKPVAENKFDLKTKSDSKPADEIEKKSEDGKSQSKLKYYSKLKHLNESVSEWIKKHVEQTPLCILTPIFKDYEKYIKDIQSEYESSSKEEKKADIPKHSIEIADTKSTTPKPAFGIPNNSTEPIKLDVSPSSKSLFSSQSNITKSATKPGTFSFGPSASIPSSPPKFNFGISTASSQSTTTTSSPFSIGTTATSTFSFSANTSTNNGTAAPFSFGVGKPFSFSSNIKQTTEKTEESNKEEEDDTPPKVEYTPVVEENSVYDKKCKIFVKKDGNFVDKGVGTLYIKKIDDSEKHQLLVRANTNLGTILLNLILVTGIPIQRMGKNNVMMVCIPTPDSKPPPTPILIRVKTSEEADELLTTLNKFKELL